MSALISPFRERRQWPVETRKRLQTLTKQHEMTQAE